MTLCNPVWRSARTHARKLGFVLGFAGALLTVAPWSALPAQAQANSNFALRDTETEELLKSYEMPLARAAGLDTNSVHVYLMGDLSVNAFATQPEDIFIMAGMLLWVKNPNELIGVMAHETGHLSAGHLSRGSDAKTANGSARNVGESGSKSVCTGHAACSWVVIDFFLLSSLR